MAEKINIGDSYYKVIDVTTKDEDGEKVPYDLTDYRDNYVAIKTDRGLPDEEAYIFKKIPFSGNPSEGKLIINLTPIETLSLPNVTRGEVEKLYAFVQIGSNITGRIHEVSALRIKTQGGGIAYQTEIDRSYNMGCLSETVGWKFDAGTLCEVVTMRIDFGDIPLNLFFDGGILSDTEVEIIDMGLLSNKIIKIYDLGSLVGCVGSRESC